MTTGLLAALFILDLAGPDPAASNARETYLITADNDREYAVFWDERQAKGNDVYLVELDTPWTTEPVFEIVKNVTKISAERPRNREERIKREAAAAGFTQVRPGYYVPSYEVALAARAREMAGITDQGDVARASPVGVTPRAASVTPQVRDQEPKGVVAHWGPHVGVVGVALLLAGLVVRFLLVAGGG